MKEIFTNEILPLLVENGLPVSFDSSHLSDSPKVDLDDFSLERIWITVELASGIRQSVFLAKIGWQKPR